MATNEEAVTEVEDPEELYRAIQDNPQNFVSVGVGGVCRLSHSAFNDKEMRPSVDRAALRGGAAANSRKSESDGVVSLIAADVRAIKGIVTNDERGRPLNSGHAIDVCHEPEPENYSHAVVAAAPNIASGSTFKRLKEALCLVAQARGWAYPPSSLR